MEGLIPVLGMVTGLVSTGLLLWALVRISQGQVGEAIAGWIASQSGGRTPPNLAREVAGLRAQVAHLEQQMVDAHERIDFTERLLAQARPGAVGGGD
jgi:hypothetical protein